MTHLEDTFNAIKQDAELLSVSGDFIPAPGNSDNAGSNYLYVNCYSTEERQLLKEEFRKIFFLTVSHIRKKDFSDDYVSVVFSIYKVIEGATQRLYRAVIWKSDLGDVASIDELRELLVKEEIY